jgi:taurine dioxygenase
MSFNVIPLSPALGAEVTGLDLGTPLTEQRFEQLRQAWIRHNGLLVVRGQRSLQPEQHLAFSRRFGPLFGEAEHLQDTVKRYLHPQHPGIYRVSNKVVAGQPLGRANAGDYWHSDVSFRERPAMASLLHGIEIPALGGDTLFASTQVAWEALSQPMQALLQPLQAVHDFSLRAALSYRPDMVVDDDFDGENRCVHPVVVRHPDSGRRALFVNPGFTAYLAGFDRAESDALLEFLFAHQTRPEFVYRHRWKAGDLVVWDNRCVVHKAVTDYQADRYMQRTTVVAERPHA